MARRPPPADTADCPAWLDDALRREWWSLAPHIAAIHGEFTPELADLLARYVDIHRQLRDAHRRRRARGESWRMTRKGPRLWPEVVAESKTSRTMLSLAQQLGCTPLSRVRILRRRGLA